MTAFYGETLGLPLVKRYGSRPGAEYQAGNLTLAIMRTADFGGTFSRNAMPIAFEVADVAVARERLEAKGVRFVSDTFDSGVCWQAICLDPDGNPLALHHRYAPPDRRGQVSTAIVSRSPKVTSASKGDSMRGLSASTARAWLPPCGRRVTVKSSASAETM